ncbi:hypothetical protein SDC9_51772 [bioreactor metagenome]|uniref:Uncharacterized protein n=1 Tax=bioreactor metagenome TaxID=1076179 RepID=A0A644WP14_9ZZZZ
MADDVDAQRRADAGLLFMKDRLACERPVLATELLRPAKTRPARSAHIVFPRATPLEIVGIGLRWPCGLEARVVGFKPVAQCQAEGFVFRRIAHLHLLVPCCFLGIHSLSREVGEGRGEGMCACMHRVKKCAVVPLTLTLSRRREREQEIREKEARRINPQRRYQSKGRGAGQASERRARAAPPRWRCPPPEERGGRRAAPQGVNQLSPRNPSPPSPTSRCPS